MPRDELMHALRTIMDVLNPTQKRSLDYLGRIIPASGQDLGEKQRRLQDFPSRREDS